MIRKRVRRPRSEIEWDFDREELFGDVVRPFSSNMDICSCGPRSLYMQFLGAMEWSI